MACAICQTRRPRRFCPGLPGDICSGCCGSEREVTVSCPLDCEYLQEARKHDKQPPLDKTQIPNRDIRVSESYLEEYQELLIFMVDALLQAAFDRPGIVDRDIREALEASIRTYRSLQSGLYYETRPDNPLAARIGDTLQERIAEFRKEETQKLGMTRTRDSDVLRLLVFFQPSQDKRSASPRPGGPGQFPARGSHRPVRAFLMHTVPQIRGSLRERTPSEPLAPAGAGNAPADG